MALRLYNTLTGKKDLFKPRSDKDIKMYVCGPTVYGPDHLGHARVGVFYDVLRRYLEYLKYNVELSQNITDVGHLTDDADQGEDKLEKAAQENQRTPKQIAEYFAKRHFNDMTRLNVKKPKYVPWASKYVPQMIEFIQGLIEKGYAYQSAGNVYFSVKKFKNYGKLSNKSLDQLREAVRVEKDPNKKDPLDFALWLKAEPGHKQKWQSPWSTGYPGWHIECSVMNYEIFGPTLDIHGGGVELAFPHHENEIAQSEAFSGKKFAKYFVHMGMVTVNGQKMGKSQGNFITIRDLLKKHTSDQIRIALLMTNFHKPYDYSLASLDRAQRVLNKLAQAKVHLKKGDSPELRKEMQKIMDNSINTPRLITFWLESRYQMKTKLFADIEKILGVEIGLPKIPATIIKKAQQREKYRQADKFEQADELRQQIESSGFTIKDTDQGPEVWPK